MIFRRHSSTLIFVALTACAESARDIAAAAPPAEQCFSLSSPQAFELTADSTLRVGTGGQMFELELSGDCEGLGGTPILTAEAGSSTPFCVGGPGGHELIIRHPGTQQSNVCHVQAVRLVNFYPAG